MGLLIEDVSKRTSTKAQIAPAAEYNVSCFSPSREVAPPKGDSLSGVLAGRYEAA